VSPAALIRCACLLVERHQEVLLVRVRDNAHWYLPGGTIECDESAEAALIREIDEELGVTIDPASVIFDRRVVGPAYGRAGTVELNCYRARWIGTLTPCSEISELGWFGHDDSERVAPAIKLLFDQLWSQVSPH
jgi:8-oxo-dGTP diphosphatase